jgi:hypothetical protein
MTHTIEQLGNDGRWFILGSAKTSGEAQEWMRHYQKLFPRNAHRVCEAATRRLIVCYDPNGEPFAALA